MSVNNCWRANINGRNVSLLTIVLESLGTHVALEILTAWASHLVASIFLDELLFALVAGPDKRSCHGLFDRVAPGYFIVLRMLLARLRNMAVGSAAAAADLLALGVVAMKLEVLLNGRHNHLVVTERALFQAVQAGVTNVFLLLQIRELLEELLVGELIELRWRKICTAACSAQDAAARVADFGLDVSLQT